MTTKRGMGGMPPMVTRHQITAQIFAGGIFDQQSVNPRLDKHFFGLMVNNIPR